MSQVAGSRGGARLVSKSTLVVVILLGVTRSAAGAASWSGRPPPSPTAPCRSSETAIVVDTVTHRLTLCEDGRAADGFAVALGSGGVDKRRAGDNKTPLGLYGLGPPRASQDFHLFVPVAYPTAAQARLGYTGSAIGIHGPPRRFARALALVPIPLPDWTAGCIAVRTDDEIDRIASWLRVHAAPKVRVEPAPAP